MQIACHKPSYPLRRLENILMEQFKQQFMQQSELDMKVFKLCEKIRASV